MRQKMRVGVIFGGRSAEHEVSLASARSVMAALDRERYEIVPIGITHGGRWLTQGDPMRLLAGSAHPSPEGDPIASDGVGRELVPGATGRAFPRLDVIFPVLHGPFGEDGTIQGLLELAGVPYVGCGVLASAVAMDKLISKALFIRHGLPVATGRGVTRKEWERDPDRVLDALGRELRYPMFVKPANLGSSVGVSKAEDSDGLRAALAEAARYDRKLLVEEAVPNAREIECSVLGNDDPIASVPGEVVPSRAFYDYAAKYINGRSELIIPAALAPKTTAQVRELAVRAFQAIDGAGLARVDFLLSRDTGALVLNEINTMPGFTDISMYPKLWEASGISFGELVDRLIELALERHRDRARSETTFEGAMEVTAPEGNEQT